MKAAKRPAPDGNPPRIGPSDRTASLTLGELAHRVGGRLLGDSSVAIRGAHTLDQAGPDEISWVADERHAAAAATSRAGALIVSAAEHAGGKPAILVDSPQAALGLCLEVLRPRRPAPRGVARGARVDRTAAVDASASIAAGATVSAGARIRARAVISAGSFVGEAAEIGEDAYLHPNATVLDRCRVGARCILHPGSVVGSDGFGYVWDGNAHRKIPQIGIARLEEDVELGANSCVDRATLGETVVGRGTKVDNLVQIGHNVVIGEHSILCGQAGLAGSARLGRRVTLAGQAGVADHLNMGDGATATGRAGVTAPVPAGATVSGMPAVPHRDFLRRVALSARLPEMLRRVTALEKRLERLERD